VEGEGENGKLNSSFRKPGLILRSTKCPLIRSELPEKKTGMKTKLTTMMGGEEGTKGRSSKARINVGMVALRGFGIRIV